VSHYRYHGAIYTVERAGSSGIAAEEYDIRRDGEEIK
jgi:hypothetical protein